VKVYPTSGGMIALTEDLVIRLFCQHQSVVRSRIVGRDRLGSPVDLRYFFRLEGDKIASLEIRP
jgi:hypothetical protein